MDSPKVKWQLTGNYFENCNCDVVCNCIFPTGPGNTTNGNCKVGLAFHVDRGVYGNVALDGLNAIVMIYSPGEMKDGNWSAAYYFDARADTAKLEALRVIFAGTDGGPMAIFAPSVTKVLGEKSVPITFSVAGNKSSVEVAGVMHLRVHGYGGVDPDKEIWAANLHGLAPEGVAMAIGDPGSTFEDYGMRWDNSGKNGHYAPIKWSNH